ncbi:protein of unknown function [Paraburkholderia kururiensis]
MRPAAEDKKMLVEMLTASRSTSILVACCDR